MQEFFNCVLAKHTLAFGAGTLIFLITILLVSRRMIGFLSSLILMLAALGATWAIDRSPETIGYWNKYTPEALHLPLNLEKPPVDHSET